MNNQFPAILIKNFTKEYFDKIAVNDISLQVPYGKVTALLGSNGAGKSTTLNAIAGIIEPTAGEIIIDGSTYKKDYKKLKNKVGYLTSEMSLYNTLTIRENIETLIALKDMDPSFANERIEFVKDRFDLHDFFEQKFEALSSGQKQRSLIAASIIHDPDILIFDEVTASLDVIISKDIMDFLIEEKTKGKAILFSTHILSEVEYISDQIYIINHGQLLTKTTYQELIAETKATNITQAFYNLLTEDKSA